MSAKEVAVQIKEIIDDLWAQEISDEDAKKQILHILDDREKRLKVLRGRDKSAVFVRTMGTKRLKAFDELLDDINV